jgi:hypothetical protein
MVLHLPNPCCHNAVAATLQPPPLRAVTSYCRVHILRQLACQSVMQPLKEDAPHRLIISLPHRTAIAVR